MSLPMTLFHGTAVHLTSSIQAVGLIKGQWDHVYLSQNIQKATKVGRRHGKLIILLIDSGRMFEQGHKF